MSVSSAKILLLGGGYTLSRVAAILPRHSFVITSRNFDKVRAWQQKNWQACLLDINQTETINGVFQQYPKLSIVIDSIPPARQAADQNVESNKFVRLLKSSKIERAIYLSTTGVFGVEDGSIVNENTLASPKHDSAKARLAYETAYLEHIKNSVILRLPAIYGPERGTGHALMSGRYPLVENGQRWSNRIHVDDLAQIIVKAIEKSPEQNLFCVSDGTPALVADVVKYYCDKFQFKFPDSITIEEAKVRGMHTVLSNQRIDSSLLYKTLGITAKFPSYVEGADDEMKNVMKH